MGKNALVHKHEVWGSNPSTLVKSLAWLSLLVTPVLEREDRKVMEA